MKSICVLAAARLSLNPAKICSVFQGKGTRKHILTRVMVSRSEIDMKHIKEEYKKNYSKTLYQEILVRNGFFFLAL